jgi:murein tripeptide amidase MpaA
LAERSRQTTFIPFLSCLALTLEMPFKNNANLPDPSFGWNDARSARLGAAILQPVLR